MTDPIRQALAAGDDCELGRIVRTQHAALLASIPFPQTPDRLPSLPPCDVGDAGDFHPDPPTPEEVIEAGEWKYGLGAEAG